jgi:protein required for attachment to host cells
MPVVSEFGFDRRQGSPKYKRGSVVRYFALKELQMSVPRLRHHARVLVADGEKALFLVNDGSPEKPDLKVVEQMAQENPPTREQGENRPGRMNDSIGFHKSAVEQTDFHKLGKQQFAVTVAGRLAEMHDEAPYNQLFLIAPPFVLGELRKHLRKDIAGVVAYEIAKDLTKQPVDQIAKHVVEG